MEQSRLLKRTIMGRTFKFNPDEQDTNLAFDDSQLSTGDEQVSANSAATGNLSISRKLSSKQSAKDRKKANRKLRNERRHDDR